MGLAPAVVVAGVNALKIEGRPRSPGYVGQGTFIWGAGFVLGIPTATDRVLGSGKWAAGPALRLTYRSGPWNLGAIAGQRWSFAGDASRPDLNALIIRGTFRFKLPGPWYLVSAPIITANWEADSGNQWTVPFGGGVGKIFKIGKQPLNAQVQAFYNVEKPDNGPDWSLRLQLQFLFPK